MTKLLDWKGYRKSSVCSTGQTFPSTAKLGVHRKGVGFFTTKYTTPITLGTTPFPFSIGNSMTITCSFSILYQGQLAGIQTGLAGKFPYGSVAGFYGLYIESGVLKAGIAVTGPTLYVVQNTITQNSQGDFIATMQRDGARLYLHVNGVRDTVGIACTGVLPDSLAKSFRVGNYTGSNDNFPGVIYGVEVDDTVLAWDVIQKKHKEFAKQEPTNKPIYFKRQRPTIVNDKGLLACYDFLTPVRSQITKNLAGPSPENGNNPATYNLNINNPNGTGRYTNYNTDGWMIHNIGFNQSNITTSFLGTKFSFFTVWRGLGTTGQNYGLLNTFWMYWTAGSTTGKFQVAINNTTVAECKNRYPACNVKQTVQVNYDQSGVTDADKLQVYINGKLQTLTFLLPVPNITLANNDFYLAPIAGGSKAHYEHIRVYKNRTFTPNEAKALHNSFCVKELVQKWDYTITISNGEIFASTVLKSQGGYEPKYLLADNGTAKKGMRYFPQNQIDRVVGMITPNKMSYGDWEVYYRMVGYDAEFMFGNSVVDISYSGQQIVFINKTTYEISLIQENGTYASGTYAPADGLFHKLRVTRDNNALFSVYIDDVLKFTYQGSSNGRISSKYIVCKNADFGTLTYCPLIRAR